MARACHRATLLPAWLRLEGRTIEPDGMTLELVATAKEEGRGQPLSLFAELLAPGDRVRVSIRIKRPAEVTVEILGGLGTPAAEVHSLGPPEVAQPPPPAEGAWVQEGVIPVYDLPALAAAVADAGKHDASLSDGAGEMVVAAPALAPESILPLSPTSVGLEKEEEPPEREVAITQELAPLERATAICACGCGGQLRLNARGGLARFLRGHGTRMRSHKERLLAGLKAGATLRGKEQRAPDASRVAELRDQVASGKYETFALFRKAATR